MCDNCLNAPPLDGHDLLTHEEVDLTAEARQFLETMAHVQRGLQNFTGYGLPCSVLVGSRAKQPLRFESFALYGCGSNMPLGFWRELARLLRAEGLLSERLESMLGSRGRYAAVCLSS